MQIPIWPLPNSFTITNNGITGLIKELNVFFENVQECEKKFLETAIARFETIAFSSGDENEPFRRVVLPPLRNESSTTPTLIASHTFSRLTIKLQTLNTDSLMIRETVEHCIDIR